MIIIANNSGKKMIATTLSKSNSCRWWYFAFGEYGVDVGADIDGVYGVNVGVDIDGVLESMSMVISGQTQILLFL